LSAFVRRRYSSLGSVLVSYFRSCGVVEIVEQRKSRRSDQFLLSQLRRITFRGSPGQIPIVKAKFKKIDEVKRSASRSGIGDRSPGSTRWLRSVARTGPLPRPCSGHHRTAPGNVHFRSIDVGMLGSMRQFLDSSSPNNKRGNFGIC
jgi:hypothetical protein